MSRCLAKFFNVIFLATGINFIAISFMADTQPITAVIELPESYEWYREQIAGHHPSVVRNGEREIGSSLISVDYHKTVQFVRNF